MMGVMGAERLVVEGRAGASGVKVRGEVGRGRVVGVKVGVVQVAKVEEGKVVGAKVAMREEWD